MQQDFSTRQSAFANGTVEMAIFDSFEIFPEVFIFLDALRFGFWHLELCSFMFDRPGRPMFVARTGVGRASNWYWIAVQLMLTCSACFGIATKTWWHYVVLCVMLCGATGFCAIAIVCRKMLIRVNDSKIFSTHTFIFVRLTSATEQFVQTSVICVTLELGKSQISITSKSFET